MDNRNKKNRSIFEKRGFYAALYSCIGAVLVLAIGITYTTMNRGRVDTVSRHIRQESPPLINLAPGALAGHNLAEHNHIHHGRRDIPDTNHQNGQPIEDGSARPQAQAAAAAIPQPVPPTGTTSAAEAPQNDTAYMPEAIPVSLPVSQTLYDVRAPREDRQNIPAETQPPATEQASAEWEDDPLAYEAILADPVFNIFTGSEDMLWPVNGEIVMDFSVDRLIHDVTLNQFRTNDKVSISANIGTQVRAAADGIVRSITTDRRLGNTVVVEHGNGWFTTYSQLQDHILVEEGDVVVEGQVIGGVGEPSIFYTLLGSHLSFRVMRDDVPVNPMIVLSAN